MRKTVRILAVIVLGFAIGHFLAAIPDYSNTDKYDNSQADLVLKENSFEKSSLQRNFWEVNGENITIYQGPLLHLKSGVWTYNGYYLSEAFKLNKGLNHQGKVAYGPFGSMTVKGLNTEDTDKGIVLLEPGDTLKREIKPRNTADLTISASNGFKLVGTLRSSGVYCKTLKMGAYKDEKLIKTFNVSNTRSYDKYRVEKFIKPSILARIIPDDSRTTIEIKNNGNPSCAPHTQKLAIDKVQLEGQ